MDKRIGGIVLLVIGIVILVLGVMSMRSFASAISNALTGAPTEKAMWLTLGGVIVTVAGAIFISKK